MFLISLCVCKNFAWGSERNKLQSNKKYHDCTACSETHSTLK